MKRLFLKYSTRLGILLLCPFLLVFMMVEAMICGRDLGKTFDSFVFSIIYMWHEYDN